jgi:hypothetical protein
MADELAKIPGKRDISEELAEIASDAARKYHLYADRIVDSLTEDEVLVAARQNPKEAPMFMHMISKFMEAQVRSNAASAKGRQHISINIARQVVLPPQRPIDDANVIDVGFIEADADADDKK